MKPILFNQNETRFTDNGRGRLVDCISCVVTEERNGIFECEFQYPVTGRMFSEIKEGRIIGIIHDDSKDIQPFDIYAHSTPLNGIVTFYAHHISYRLGNVILKPMTASSCVEAFTNFPNKTYNPCPFSFWTDKAVAADWKNDVPSPIKAILGGVEGSILDIYGKGEYEWDKWTVKLHVNRGNDNGVSIRYGVNLTDLLHDYDVSGSYNAVVPYWKSEEDGTLVTLSDGYIAVDEYLQPWTTNTGAIMEDGNGNVIYFKTKAASIAPIPMDLSDAFESQPTEAQLRAEAIRRLENSEAWLPSENITVQFVNLADTEDYKDISALQRVRLCDKVSVYCGPLSISAIKMQVIRVVYDVLAERYDEIELGKPKTSFADTLKASMKSYVDQKTAEMVSSSMLQEAIDNATDHITGAHDSHVTFVYDANGGLQEILIMDTESITTATKVWRWNSGGLGYSSNGYAGPYSLAMTQDGAIVADMITTGVLNANLIKAGILSDGAGKNYWNLLTGEFSLSGGAAFGSSTVSAVVNAMNAAISDVDVEYAQNQSTSTAPTSGWSTTAPAWRDGYYIWQRTKTTAASGVSYSQPTCISGRDGATGPQGQTGATGIGVSAIVEQYYLSTSSSTQAGGSWSTSQPAWSSGKYIWTRSMVTWTDNTTTYTTPVLAQAINGANSTAKAASDAVTTLDNSLNQQGVFNRLTNNGQTQGIYLNNGLLYINASFIKSGIIDGTVVQAKLLNIINASNTVIASFDDSIRIGKQDKVHIVIDYNSLDIYKNATTAVFLVGDLQDSNGRARQVEHYTGDGSRRYFVIHSYRATIVSIKVNGSEVTEYTIGYAPDTTGLTLESAPANGADVRVEYTVSSSVFHYDFGIRNGEDFVGNYSVIEGDNTIASGQYSHAEGSNTVAGGYYSHAEGEGTKIEFTGNGILGGAHAEGYQTSIQSSDNSFAQGAHVEGYQCSVISRGGGNHAEGYKTKVNGYYGCHAEGAGTIARGFSQHVAGRYNVEDTGGGYSGIYAEIIGNGTSDNDRSNARTLYKTGNEWIAGTLTQASDSRLKDESGEIPDLSTIRARRFKWNDKKGTHDDLDHIGYFAQDVEKIAPYLVQEDAMGYKSLDYNGVMVAKIASLEKRVAELERIIIEMKRGE